MRKIRIIFVPQLGCTSYCQPTCLSNLGRKVVISTKKQVYLRSQLRCAGAFIHVLLLVFITLLLGNNIGKIGKYLKEFRPSLSKVSHPVVPKISNISLNLVFLDTYGQPCNKQRNYNTCSSGDNGRPIGISLHMQIKRFLLHSKFKRSNLLLI